LWEGKVRADISAHKNKSLYSTIYLEINDLSNTSRVNTHVLIALRITFSWKYLKPILPTFFFLYAI